MPPAATNVAYCAARIGHALIQMKRKIPMLCTGNSVRSQMAEAIVNTRPSDEWEAFSAGTEPVGYVHPHALCALAEVGVLHQGSSNTLTSSVMYRSIWSPPYATTRPRTAPHGWGRKELFMWASLIRLEPQGRKRRSCPYFVRRVTRLPAGFWHSSGSGKNHPNKEADSDVKENRSRISR